MKKIDVGIAEQDRVQIADGLKRLLAVCAGFDLACLPVAKKGDSYCLYACTSSHTGAPPSQPTLSAQAMRR
jgi:hypothetical protein